MLDELPFAPDPGDERSLAPEGKTPPSTVRKVVELLGLSAEHTVFDLGSGDGEAMVVIAETCGARCVGYEINEELVAQSRALAEARGVSDLVEVRCEDLETASIPLDGNSILFVFLTPWAVNLLYDRLAAALQAGATVVSFLWYNDALVKELGCTCTELDGSTYIYVSGTQQV